jgi:hypothetical protein
MGSRLGTGLKRRYAKPTQQQGSECDISRRLSLLSSLHEYACEGRRIACGQATGAVIPRCIICSHFIQNMAAPLQNTLRATGF